MAGRGVAQLRTRPDVVLRVEDLVVEHRSRRTRVQAVSGVSFDIVRGETLGLVGESGCGKTSTGRAILQLPPPTSGSVRFDGAELTELQGEERRRTRARLQMIFQDPLASLNPRRKVRDIVAEGLRVWRPDDPEAQARVERALSEVGMDAGQLGDRRPHELSGGQSQRVCIARSLALEPDVLICDEPVSALDVSVQAQILNLLAALKARHGLTMLFIAHDLAVVRHISDRVAVMYLGRLCELASAGTLYSRPAHPYTRALLASVPRPQPGSLPEAPAVAGELPSPLAPPSGCRFRTRCPRAEPRCELEEPQMRPIGDDHFVACHFPHA